MTGTTHLDPQSTANAAGDNLDTRRKRAIYRANYRGTKEMDWLLGKYGEARIPTMAADELAMFETLLALPDPPLQGWLMNGDVPRDHPHAGLIAAIRAFHKA